MSNSERAPRAADLVVLHPDHPGFSDPVYRKRRQAIADLALRHHPGSPVPTVAYRTDERRTWACIWEQLQPLHRARACREWLAWRQQLPIHGRSIPQLDELNRALAATTGARLAPVAGLISPRVFLRHLGRGVLLSTQYLRHGSQPFYTPEPDLVHELVGHAPTLVHAGMDRLNQLLGGAAEQASETEMQRLERLYWYGLEFSLVREGSELKAFGAGLLSSAGELAGFDLGPELLPLDPERMAETPYDPTGFQPRLFVAPSFADLIGEMSAWLSDGSWRDGANRARGRWHSTA